MEELERFVRALIKHIPDQTLEQLAHASEDELWQFHFGLGQWLRNEFLHGPENPDVVRGLAVALKVDNEPDAVSEALIRRIWEQCQSNESTDDSLLRTADALCGKSKYEQAIPISEQCLQAGGNSGHLLTNLSYAYLHAGQHSRCIEVIGPRIHDIGEPAARAATLVNVGRCLLAAASAEAAESAFESACPLDPSNVEAYLGLIDACVERGNFERFRAAAESAQLECGQSARLHNHLGATYMDSWREPRIALMQFEIAISRDPENAEAHNNSAIALVALERFDDAIAAARTALTLEPRYENARWNLCVALFHAGKLDEVADAAATALKLFPQSANRENFQGICEDALSRI